MSARTFVSTPAAAAVISLLAAATVAVPPAAAGSLENLERERAHLIELFLDGGLQPQERQVRIEAAGRRLRDLERMVMRDESLVGRNTPTVRRAFESYDLTFLLHASAEAGVSMVEAWFAEVGVSTETLMATRAGSR